MDAAPVNMTEELSQSLILQDVLASVASTCLFGERGQQHVEEYLFAVLSSRGFFFYLRNDSVEKHPRLVSHQLVHQAPTDERQNAPHQLSGILS